MSFCDHCERVLRRSTTNSVLTYSCDVCKIIYDPKPEDTLILKKSMIGTTYNTTALKKYASFDRVNSKKAIPCPKCKIPYMTLVVVGGENWLSCKCGFKLDTKKVDTIIV